jgi:endonuclease/exonuclease/phosphatase family metal-dependent hydrolase
MHIRPLCLFIGLAGLRVFGFVTDPWLSDERIHQVTGEPTRFGRPRDPAVAVKIVTWNIERGQAYPAVLAVLRGLDPDVILLQEVDDGCRRSGYRKVAKDLADTLGMNWVASGEFQELGEGRAGDPALTGQAVLSRFAIDDADPVRFKAQDRWRWSVNPVQPRRGGRLALRVRTAGLLFYNTHIESGGDEALQRKQMAEIVADAAEAGGKTPVLIAGDFNNRIPRTALTFPALLEASFVDALGDDAARGPTSRGRRHPIDWMFVKRAAAADGRIIQAPTASDHSPLMTTLLPWPSPAARYVGPQVAR